MSTTIDTTAGTTRAPSAPTRPSRLHGPRIDHLGSHHGWGPVVAVHELGRYAIVEYLRDNSNMLPLGSGADTHGKPAFSVTIDDRYIVRAFPSLEEALVGAVEFVAAGANCQLAALFHRASTGSIAGDTAPRRANLDDELSPRAELAYRIGAFTFYTLDGQWFARTSRGVTAARPTLERAIVAAVALERGRPWAAEFFEVAAFGVIDDDPVFDGVQVSQLAVEASRWQKLPRTVVAPRDSEPVGLPVTVIVNDGSHPSGEYLSGHLEHVEETSSGRVDESRFGRVRLDQPLWGRTHVTVSMCLVRRAG